jgi:uncharacterized integral membrane protein
MNLKLILSLVLLGLLVIFSAQNYEVVQVRFLFWRLEMSRAVLLLLVLAVGLAIGWTFSTIRHRSGSSGHGGERLQRQ